MTGQEIVDNRQCFGVTEWVSSLRGLAVGDILIPTGMLRGQVVFQCERTGSSRGDNDDDLCWYPLICMERLRLLPPQPNHTPHRR